MNKEQTQTDSILYTYKTWVDHVTMHCRHKSVFTFQHLLHHFPPQSDMHHVKNSYTWCNHLQYNNVFDIPYSLFTETFIKNKKNDKEEYLYITIYTTHSLKFPQIFGINKWVPALSYGIVCVILSLAIFVELWIVTYRRTRWQHIHYGTASSGKNGPRVCVCTMVYTYKNDNCHCQSAINDWYCYRSTQPSTLHGTVKWVPAKGRWCSAAGE